jgi:hypothetical protein
MTLRPIWLPEPRRWLISSRSTSLVTGPGRPKATKRANVPFRALDHDELLGRMVEHSRRNVAATRALSERGGAASVVFTGAELTAEQLTGPPSVCRGPSGCWRTLGSHRAIATVACGSTASMSPARPGGPGRADWQ